MLSGLMNTGASMLPAIATPNAPNIEDMEQARMAALYRKVVRLKNFKSETFDLSDPNDNNKYMKLMLSLFKGVQDQTHIILAQDRRFVDNKEHPGWLIHLEWAEYELNVSPNEVTMPGEKKHKGAANAKAGT